MVEGGKISSTYYLATERLSTSTLRKINLEQVGEKWETPKYLSFPAQELFLWRKLPFGRAVSQGSFFKASPDMISFPSLVTLDPAEFLSPVRADVEWPPTVGRVGGSE